MPVLDFKEIPEAHVANGLQDTFELFAREYLSLMGYKVISHPDRGADAGKDLIVEECRQGVGGVTTVRWLVSCKHNAHSGSSVTPTVEQNIIDRLRTHNCDSFMGFYSTIPSSGLTTNLDRFITNNNIEYLIYDRELIERLLLSSDENLQIVKRFFPKSYRNWENETPLPVKLHGEKSIPNTIFNQVPSLKCYICKNELLGKEIKGVVTSWSVEQEHHLVPEPVKYFNWTCQGNCENILIHNMMRDECDLINSRREYINDIVNPVAYIQWLNDFIGDLYNKSIVHYRDAFYDKSEFLNNLYPYACRNPTTEERKSFEGQKITF